MARPPRFWQSATWRKALHVDSDLAEIEGLAAGTGLLTGDLARSARAEAVDCPTCGGIADAVVIDLVARAVTHRCRACGHRWTMDEPARSKSPG
ncbi:MAG: hypothetical protein JWM47_61 [Acidimicrobiales bacterium]|nr:hypothetical protein [Acidimicrobiales bacterium]